MNPNSSQTPMPAEVAQTLLNNITQIAVASINSRGAVAREDLPVFLDSISDALVRGLQKGRATLLGFSTAVEAITVSEPLKAETAVRSEAAQPAVSAPGATVVETAPAAEAAQAASLAAETEQMAVSEAASEEEKTDATAESAEGNDEGAQETASDEPPPYKFAHLSRDPYMDPEEAIKGDEIICLIDGSSRKMMSRHLRGTYGMEPDEYRAHFNLRADYPLTAPGYSKEKSIYAKQQGLGTTAFARSSKKRKRTSAKGKLRLVASKAPSKVTPAKGSKRQKAKASTKSQPTVTA